MPSVSSFSSSDMMLMETMVMPSTTGVHPMDISSSAHSTFAVQSAKKRTLTPPASPSSRSVTFDPMTSVVDTLHANDYTLEERAASWFCKQECREMRTQRRVTVRLMEAQTEIRSIDDDEHYFRGLESKTVNGSRRKQFVAFDATLAVLDEQANQACFGDVSSKTLAKVYMESTVGCAEEARQKALYDRQQATKEEV